MVILNLALFSSYGQQGKFSPPPNKPAIVKWDLKNRHLTLVYDKKLVLDAEVRIVDHHGFPDGSVKIKLETSNETSGKKLTQRIKFVPEAPAKSFKFILRAKFMAVMKLFLQKRPAEKHKESSRMSGHLTV